MKLIILLFLVLASVYSLEDQCDDIQDIMAVELSPVKTFIDDQAVKFEKKINSKLYDAVSGLVTCNDTLSTYLNCFLKTNNVESLKNFSNTFKVTVDSTYEKIRANFTQAMVAKRTTAFNTKLYETIQQVVQIKTKELKDLIAVKTGNRTCFVEVFKTTFKILTNKFISNIGDFLIDSRDQKISDKLVKYIINLNKWCDEIPKEVNHCKETTFMTCCIDAYLAANGKDIIKEIDFGMITVDLEAFLSSLFDEEKLKLTREINNKFQTIYEQLEDTCI